MDVTQHIVAVGDGIHDAAEGIQVIELIQRFALGLHFPVNGINMLDAAVDGSLDAHGFQPLGHFLLDGTHEGLVLLFVGHQIGHDVLVFSGIQIPQ